jgi:flavin-dependent dehydrogenase
VGAGIAGLLAARALADAFDSVVVLDRDDFDDEGLARPGVPQGRHTHLLLPGGLNAIEGLLPGFTADLIERGGRRGDVQERVLMCVGRHRIASGRCGADLVSGSRGMVESTAHRLVSRVPGVEIRPGTSVLDLIVGSDASRVRGVRVAPRDGGPVEELAADLVVDATGRGSRLQEWLGRRGYAVPGESSVRIDERYVTRRFRVPRERDRGLLVIAQGGSPANFRSGIAAHERDDVWTVSLSGYRGDQPARDLPGFVDFAHTLEAPYLAELVDGAEPLDEGASYRFVSNMWRHYERLPRFPSGLLALGDAVCSLDPVKGQGMSLAALQAVVLRDCLSAGPDGLAERFFPAAAAVLAEPWMVAVSAHRDRRRPRQPRELAGAGFERYLDLLVAGAVDDPRLAADFLRTAALVAPSSSLLAPRTAGRVLLRLADRARRARTGQQRGGLATGADPAIRVTQQ